MTQLNKRNRLLIGLTLFSMFFGAGNLIFPPFLGSLAGTDTWPAMLGFAVSAIGFPVLGVVAVAKSGGLTALASRVHPWFAAIFTLLIYLSIGPCLAIPRTASTSFEMAVIPFIKNSAPVGLLQLLYSIVFFTIALYLAFTPDKLTDRLGKIMTPCLLALILLIFAGCLLNPGSGYGQPSGSYEHNPLVNGFLNGYQTMDTIAALNFGIIISLNIKAKGVEKESSVVKETILAGLLAGLFLLLVYASLAHVGAMSGGQFPGSKNGAETLTRLVSYLFGRWGMVILALIFAIACLNTCIGLLSCCSKYFCTICPRISYRKWVLIFAVASTLIANAGLNKILEFSIPVLNAIYPVAIVLIILSFLPKKLLTFHCVYPVSIAFTGITSILYALDQKHITIPLLTPAISQIPFYNQGLGWLIPAVLGLLCGLLLSLLLPRRSRVRLE